MNLLSMNLFQSEAVPGTTPAALAREGVCACADVVDDGDDAIYDEIEALLQDRMLLDSLLQDDLPRRGCVELAQALEDVIALLMPPMSEFSDPRAGLRPMGVDPDPR